ncbi:MAG: TolC family protein [Bacteroidota bacterium]
MYRIIAFWACFLAAQAVTQAQLPLSLTDAINRGLENNFGLAIAELDLENAELNNNWATAGRYPRLDLSVDGSLFRSGNPGSFVPGRENVSTGISLNWTIFDGYRVMATKSRLEILEKQSEGNAAIVVENAVQAIALAYYDLLTQQEQIEVLQEILNNSRERLAYEQFRKDLGASGTFELLQFQTNVINDSINLISSQLNIRNAERTFRLLLQEEDDFAFELTDEFPDLNRAYEWDDLFQAMSANNQNLRNQFLNQQLRAQESRIARADQYPTIQLNTGGTYAVGRILRRNFDPATVETMPTIPTNFSAFDYTAGFSLNFTLFDGGNLRRQLASAHLQEEVVALETQELQQNLSVELRNQWDQLSVRQQIWRLQREAVTQTAVNLEVGREQFQAGLINSLDYRTILLQYRNAQLAQLQSGYLVLETEWELMRLTGGLIQDWR